MVLSINAYSREKALKVFTLLLAQVGSTTGTIYVDPDVDVVYFLDTEENGWNIKNPGEKALGLFGGAAVREIRYLMLECEGNTLTEHGFHTYSRNFSSLEAVLFLQESDVKLTLDEEENGLVILPENHVTSVGVTVQQIKADIIENCGTAMEEKPEWKIPRFEIAKLEGADILREMSDGSANSGELENSEEFTTAEDASDPMEILP